MCAGLSAASSTLILAKISRSMSHIQLWHIPSEYDASGTEAAISDWYGHHTSGGGGE